MTDDIVTFIRARLEEDKHLAHAAAQGDCAGEWWAVESKHNDDGKMRLVKTQAPYPDSPDPTYWGGATVVALSSFDPPDYVDEANLVHIARHDPARVRRGVEAKRRILDEHGVIYRDVGWLEDGDEMGAELPVCGRCVPRHSHFQCRDEVPEGVCLTSRLMASEWSTHPDYKEAWRA